MNINPQKFILTFKANGVTVFVTDVHRDVYKELEALFTIYKGTFKQYFTQKAFNRALGKGLNFYKNTKAVKNYKANLKIHNRTFKKFFRSNIQNQKTISKPKLKKFFSHTMKLCKDYTKMNIEFTDKAFEYQNTNKTIKHNLKLVMGFKDEVRAFMNTVLFEASGYTNSLFKILGKQFGLEPVILKNLTQKELAGLYTNKMVNKAKVLKRQKAFISVWNKNLPIEGQQAKSIIQIFEKAISSTAQIKGQVANKGKARGRVKVISVDYNNLAKTNKEIEKMKKGNILVAETTAPELILACKKAAAIITDLGGLMSHAAIVSRELGIPCIVGTKIATKIFKTGDLVEVDANKGTVKKLDK